MYENTWFTQEKADELLASVIETESSILGNLGPQRIDPHVRITHNVSTLGTAAMKQDAFGYYFKVSISDQAARDERRAVSLITHEVLHTCPGCLNHGATFKRLGSRITDATGIRVSRTFDDASFGDDGHLLRPMPRKSHCEAHHRVSDPLDGRTFEFENGHSYTVLYRLSGYHYGMICLEDTGRRVRMSRRDVEASLR